MGCRVGDEVGYTVRFEDCSDVRRTGVRYLTEGVLMRYVPYSPQLSTGVSSYSTSISSSGLVAIKRTEDNGEMKSIQD